MATHIFLSYISFTTNEVEHIFQMFSSHLQFHLGIAYFMSFAHFYE